jgi:CHAT domain-containing protein
MCQRRATAPGAVRKLVAIGDPSEDLNHAAHEASMVANALHARDTVTLIAEGATKDAVVAGVAGATHVHLACHGSAAVAPDGFDAALWLAGDGELSASDVLALET